MTGNDIREVDWLIEEMNEALDRSSHPERVREYLRKDIPFVAGLMVACKRAPLPQVSGSPIIYTEEAS